MSQFSIGAFYQAASPQKLAAIIAGVLACFTALSSATLTYRMHRQRIQLDRDIDNVREVRNHLEETDGLLHRVSVSFGRLGRMAPELAEDDMLVETTNTLDVYAEYTRHLSSRGAISYPPEISNAIADVQREVSRLFLDLRRPGDERQNPDSRKVIDEDLARLSGLTREPSALIRKRVRVVI